jgi:hypothetical protein
MSTLYFNNEVDSSPGTAGNYWTDAACEHAASGLPAWSADTVHVVDDATMRIATSITLALTGTATLIIDSGGGLTIDAGGTMTLATGSALTLSDSATVCGTLTAASGSTLTIASGKQLLAIAGSTVTLAGSMAGSGTVYPHYGSTVTIAGVVITTGPTVAPSASKIGVALEFGSQIQSATPRLPAHQGTGDYSVATLAATRAALIQAQAAVAASAYKARTGDATALVTITTEMTDAIADSLLVASQAEVLVDQAVAALLA